MTAGMPTPEWLEPMAATLTQDRFTGPDWLFEPKFDGIRLLAYKQGDDIHLYSRNRLPQNLPAIARAVRALPVEQLIVDGDVLRRTLTAIFESDSVSELSAGAYHDLGQAIN